MLSRLLKLTTFALLGAAIFWGVWFSRAGSPLLAGIGVLLIVFGYTAPLALEFFAVWCVHGDDASPKATAMQLLKSWWNEALTMPRVFCWHQPFRSDVVPDFLSAESTARGVVMVHGFLSNRGFWNRWMLRLKACDVPFVAVNLEPVFGSINDYIQGVEQAVRRVEAATGRPPVLVGHSMGGLAIRAWLGAQPRYERVHHVITIGTPHRGTWLGRFGWSRNTRQMAEGADWHRQLALAESPQRLAQFTCFYSHCDNVVFPASNATLKGADNQHVPGVAHVQLVDQEIVFNEVRRWAQEQ